jgi:Ca-activated chloride channel family protein
LVDPGLLEYADYKTIRARIFPIPAHGSKKVELEYTQLLKAEGGLMKYRFPLKTENAGATDEVDVHVKLNSKQGVRTIWSPSHTITTERDGDHAAKIAYVAHGAVPDKDFFLYYSLSDKDLAASVLTHKDSGEDGYYLLTLAPPVESKEVAAKDIVLVADTSGSMAGARMDENKKALKYLVNALSPDDRFSIVQFNTDVDSFKPQLLAATAENKKLALAYIDDLEARGGTNIGDAIKTAGTMLDTASGDAARPAYVILMTDGEPTVGETTEAGLLKSVSAKRDIRLFDFGVGYDVNTKLLNKLAESHHGTAHYVEPDESIETSLSSFYSKIKSPVLTDVKIAYDGIEVKDSYPREVKDIFAGGQVLVLGRYKNSGNATIKLTGSVNGVQKAYSFPVAFAAAEADHTYLPRLWAMRRIGHLTDVAKDNGDTREVVDEIVALSKKYGIISQYTSFLVTDPNELNAHGMPVGVVGSAGGGGGGGAPAPMRARRLGDRGVRLDSFAAAPPVAMGKTLMYGDEGSMAADAVVAFAKAAPVGREAVLAAKKVANLKEEQVAMKSDADKDTKAAADKTFILRDGVWVDTAYDEKSSPKAEEITFGSKEYFDLLNRNPGISKYLAVGRQVLFVFNGHTYRITFKETA